MTQRMCSGWVFVLALLLCSCATPTPPETKKQTKAEIDAANARIEEMRKRNLAKQGVGGGDGPSSAKTTSTTPKVKLPDIPVEKRGNQRVKDFNKAKSTASGIFRKKPVTFYCGCTYEPDGRGGKPNWDSCGYTPKKRTSSRAVRIEWEHIVPASAFGHSFPEWKDGHSKCVGSKGPYKGRRCVGKVSEVFRMMEADLFNLRPAIGEVNGHRSNRPMGEVPGLSGPYGDCEMKISKEAAEPPDRVKGDVARTYLYMDWAYPNRGILDMDRRMLMEEWNALDPPDEAELNWARLVGMVQKNVNPWLTTQ